jgi:hypothetical protein
MSKPVSVIWSVGFFLCVWGDTSQLARPAVAQGKPDLESGVVAAKSSAKEYPADKLRAIAVFLPAFEAPGFRFGEWVTPQSTRQGQVGAPYFVPSETADKFAAAAYAAGWILSGFDWSRWQQTPEGRRLLSENTTLAQASPEQLARLLTTIIRKEKFAEGSLEAAFKSGLLMRILQRAAVLLAETEVEAQQKQRK